MRLHFIIFSLALAGLSFAQKNVTDSLERIIARERKDSATCKAMMQLGDRLIQLGEMDKAAEHYFKAYSLSLKLNYRKGTLLSLRRLSVSY